MSTRSRRRRPSYTTGSVDTVPVTKAEGDAQERGQSASMAVTVLTARATSSDPQPIFRRPRVQLESGHSRSTLCRHIADGIWVSPVRIGPRAVGWPAAEVAALNAARIAGQDDDDIRQLVARLHAERRSAVRRA